MKKPRKALVALPIALAVLFVANGMASNLIFKQIAFSMYDNVEKVPETDESIVQLKIGQLVGYARSTDFSVRKKAIIYFGGAGEIAYNSMIKYLGKFDDFVFISADYPGTQDSGGEMTLEEMQLATMQLFDYAKLLEYVDPNEIYVIGYSYGTGMATYLASKRDCSGLVLVSPYRDLLDLYDSRVPVYSILFKDFVTDNIDTKTYAKSVLADTMIITSEDDETFSPEIANSLAKNFSNIEVIKYEDINHSGYLSDDRVIKQINDFCK